MKKVTPVIDEDESTKKKEKKYSHPVQGSGIITDQILGMTLKKQSKFLSSSKLLPSL